MIGRELVLNDLQSDAGVVDEAPAMEYAGIVPSTVIMLGRIRASTLYKSLTPGLVGAAAQRSSDGVEGAAAAADEEEVEAPWLTADADPATTDDGGGV